MQAEMIPEFIRQRTKLFRAPELGRPAAGRIQNRVTPISSRRCFASFLFVNLIDRDRKLKIVFIIRRRNAERGLCERQILANDVHTGRDGNPLVKQESAGGLAQSVAVEAKNATRA